MDCTIKVTIFNENFFSMLGCALRGSTLIALSGVLWCLLEAPSLHAIDKEVFGIIVVRLALFRKAVTVIRNAFQLACLNTSEECEKSRLVNLVWATVPAVTICSLLFGFIWSGNGSWLLLPSEKYLDDYQLAVQRMLVSFVIGSFAEPPKFFARPSPRWQKCEKVIVKFFRTAIIVVTANYYPQYCILASAYGEIVIAIILLVGHWLHFFLEWKRHAKLLGKEDESCIFDSPLAEFPFGTVKEFFPSMFFPTEAFPKRTDIALTFVSEIMMNEVLSDGELYVMTFSPALSFAEQGIYYVLRRLTFRVKDFVFDPIQETSSQYYCEKLRCKPLKKHMSLNNTQLSVAFSKFLRISVLIGCSLLVFGLSCSHLFADIYAGSFLIDHLLLMKAQFLVLFLMGIMDVTVTFASFSCRIMLKNDMELYDVRPTWSHCVALFISGLASYLAGCFGFTMVNVCYFGSVILHSLWIIHRNLNGAGIMLHLNFFSNLKEVLALGTALFIAVLSELFIYPHSIALHLGLSVISVAVVLDVIVVTELRGWGQVFSFFRRVFGHGQL